MCPSCQTDLTLFDLGGQTSHETVNVAEKDGRSIDEILASIMEGKEDHREIFETLKNVARESPESGEVVTETKAVPGSEAGKDLGEQFLCPVCETLVAADATACPGCGAEFTEGEATEYECPVCRASVPSDADRCPSCGVRFAETEAEAEQPQPQVEVARPPPLPVEPARPPPAAPVAAAGRAPARPARIPLQNRLDKLRQAQRETDRKIPSGDRKLLYRELPKLVNEVKPLLVSAKRIGLEIDDGKRIINEAIQAGKGRDIERAVTLISEARMALDLAFVEFIGGRIDSFVQEIQVAKGDAGMQLAMPKLQAAVGRLEAGDYDGAWDQYEGSRGTFRTDAKDYTDARTIIEEGDRLARDARTMGIEVREAERLLRQGREAMDRRDVAGASRLGRAARERLQRDVPAFVQEEMRKARNALLDLKMRGDDLGSPISILKEASALVKQESWGEALGYIRDFYKEIERRGKSGLVTPPR
ncbi:MAG TPA: zinc ribbon domain-containing protein [Thermoplasmata archaeon]